MWWFRKAGNKFQGLSQIETDGSLLQYPLLTFSQLGITKARGDHGFFTVKLYDNSRNLTDKQMFFPSGAFLNEMVAQEPDHNNNFSIFRLQSDSVFRITKSRNTNQIKWNLLFLVLQLSDQMVKIEAKFCPDMSYLDAIHNKDIKGKLQSQSHPALLLNDSLVAPCVWSFISSYQKFLYVTLVRLLSGSKIVCEKCENNFRLS